MYEKMVVQDETLTKAMAYSLGLIPGCGACYARIVFEIQQRKNDRIEIEAQAFQLDADSNLLAAPNGAASRTSGTMHVIATSGIAAGTHCLKPGWVRVVGDYDDTTVDPNIPRVTAKPTEPGTIGDNVYDTESGIQYRFDMGELERIRQAKCEEMVNIISQSQQIMDLDF